MSISKLRAIALGAVAALAATVAFAEDYPSHPITLVVPFQAGGPTDAAGRLIGDAISSRIGQPVVVQNVAGAGSTIGAARVAEAEPDGYTLLMATSTAMVVAPHIYNNLGFDGYRSFDPIGLVTQAPFVLLVSADSDYETLGDLMDYGRANPDALNYATPGVGTVQHLAMEMLIAKADVKAVHIPFKGTSAARTAFLGGEVDYMIETPNAAVPLIDSGKARALAVLSADRVDSLGDLPTAKEQGLDVEARSWFAVMAPKGTPEDRIETLRGLLDEALADDEVDAKMKASGFVPSPTPTAEFESMLETEYNNFKTVVESAGITLQ